MAKITGPLHSNSASGSIGPCLTFSERKSGSQVRFQKKQKFIISAWGQADQKSLYRVIYARWISFSAAQKKAYDDEAKAKGLAMSGWNLFLKKAMADPKTYLGLVGYWSMNRTGFGTILDLSKNGNVGTLKPSWPSNSPFYVDSKNKKLLNALSFDGNDYVSAPHSPSLATSTTNNRLSWGCWFKETGAWSASHEMLINKEVGARYISVYKSELFASLQIGGAQRTFNSGFFPSIGEWYFAMVTWDGTRMRFYVDGILKATSVSYAGQALDFGTGVFQLGTYGAALFLSDGLIDDVRIYNRALGAMEILKLYNLFK